MKQIMVRHTSQSAGIAAVVRFLGRIFSLDVRSLAAFRIAIAGTLLLDLLLRSFDLRAFYTDQGVLPRATLLNDVAHRWHVSLHLINGQPAFQAFLFLVAAVFASMMLVGYKTRLATIVSWLLLMSLHVRNPLIINGGDSYLRLLLFWAIFLPLSRSWSIDAKRTSDARSPNAGSPPAGASEAPYSVFSIATMALYLQVVILYFTTGILKADIAAWQSGNAVAITLSMENLVSPIGARLASYPEFLRLLTHSTLLLEILGPLALVFSRRYFRLAVVAAFAAFHLGLAVCFYIGLFPVICVAAMTAFLPAEFWHWCFGEATASQEQGNSRRIKRRHRARVQTTLGSSVLIQRVAVWSFLLLALTVTVWSSLKPIYKDLKPPRFLYNVGAFFKLNQSWQMFVRLNDSRSDGWYVVHGRLHNGQSINLLTGESPVSYDKPERIADTFPSFRWRKFLSSTRDSRNKPVRAPLGRYFRRTWDATHVGEERLERLRIYYVKYREEVLDDEPVAEVPFTLVFEERYDTLMPVRKTQLYGWRRPVAKPEPDPQVEGFVATN